MKKNRNPYHQLAKQYGVIDGRALFVGSRRLARASNRGVGTAWRRRWDAAMIRALRGFVDATVVHPIEPHVRQVMINVLRAEQIRIARAMRAAR